MNGEKKRKKKIMIFLIFDLQKVHSKTRRVRRIEIIEKEK